MLRERRRSRHPHPETSQGRVRKVAVALLRQELHDDIWLVSFVDYDLGYFDLETRELEPLENPFGPKVLPM